MRSLKGNSNGALNAVGKIEKCLCKCICQINTHLFLFENVQVKSPVETRD